MALLPVPTGDLELRWMSSVVDVSPNSRYTDRSGPDVASVSTSFVVDAPDDGQFEFLLPSSGHARVALVDGVDGPSAAVDDIESDAGDYASLLDQLSRMAADLEVDADPSGALRVHRLKLPLPSGRRVLQFSALVPVFAGDDGVYRFSAVVPSEYGKLVKGGHFSVVALLPRETDGFEVRLESVAEVGEVHVFGRDLPLLGGRQAVSWTWDEDPPIDLSYVYFP